MNKLALLLLAAMPVMALDVQFDNSTEPFTGDKNHLGLYVDTGAFFKDTKEFVLAPISYQPQVGLGYGIKPQGEPVTVSVTVSGIEAFALELGESIDWTFLNHGGALQKGTVVVADASSLTVENLLIMANETPSGLMFKRPESQAFGLVYTRQPRHQTPITEGPYAGLFDDLSNWVHVMDIGRFDTAAEADLVRQYPDGTVEVIHACTTVEDVCTAQEARVSPDGSSVAYSLSKAPRDTRKWVVWPANGPQRDVGLWDYTAETAEIWIYEVDTKEKYPVSSGHMDRGVEWYSNDVLVFASDRAGTYAPLPTAFPATPDQPKQQRVFYPRPAHHIWRAELKGRELVNFRDITPDANYAMTPEVLSNGTILFSQYEGVWPRDHPDYNFGITPANHWWITGRSVNGLDIKSSLGGHSVPIMQAWTYTQHYIDPARRGEQDTGPKGRRGVVELFRSKEGVPSLVTVSYYANNSTGQLGAIFSWNYSPDSEGELLADNIPAATVYSTGSIPGSGQFTPSTYRPITPWALNQDQPPRYVAEPDGRALGRAGYAAAYPNKLMGTEGRFIYTRARGHCYEAAQRGMATYEAMGGEYPCKKEIHVALNPRKETLLPAMIVNPFDVTETEVIACAGDEWQCFDAVPLVRYQDLWGQEAPETEPLLPAPEGDCEVRVTKARESELYPIPGKEDSQSRKDFSGNSTVTNSEYAEQVVNFGVQTFRHWDKTPDREGYMVVNNPIMGLIQPDGSATLKVPCGKPFMHFGFDKDGNKIASGISPLSANGDMECEGCHLHSTDSKQ